MADPGPTTLRVRADSIHSAAHRAAPPLLPWWPNAYHDCGSARCSWFRQCATRRGWTRPTRINLSTHTFLRFASTPETLTRLGPYPSFSLTNRTTRRNEYVLYNFDKYNIIKQDAIRRNVVGPIDSNAQLWWIVFAGKPDESQPTMLIERVFLYYVELLKRYQSCSFSTTKSIIWIK